MDTLCPFLEQIYLLMPTLNVGEIVGCEQPEIVAEDSMEMAFMDLPLWMSLSVALMSMSWAYILNVRFAPMLLFAMGWKTHYLVKNGMPGQSQHAAYASLYLYVMIAVISLADLMTYQNIRRLTGRASREHNT